MSWPSRWSGRARAAHRPLASLSAPTVLLALAGLASASAPPGRPLAQAESARPGEDEAAAPWLALDALDAARAEAAFASLREQGEAAAAEALAQLAEGVGARPLAGRRLRARLVLERGGAREVEPAARLLAGGEADPELRLALARFLGRAELGAEHAAERAAALGRLARADLDARVRREALQGLAALPAGEGARELAALCERLVGGDRRSAAAALASAPHGRGVVLERVPAWAAEGTDEALLAELLPAYGRALAEAGGGGERAAERAPLVLGLRHPEPRVRAAAAAGLDALLARLRVLGRDERLARLLERLEDEGVEPAALALERARLDLLEGGVPDRALERLERAEAALALGRELEPRATRARIAALEAVACLLLEEPERGARALERAAELLDGLLAERPDRTSSAGEVALVDWLGQRASLELCRACFALAEDVPTAGGPDLRPPARLADALEAVRQAHALSLEALERAESFGFVGLQRWDELVDAELSPRIALDGALALRRSPARALALLERLFRALASVAPHEMPGFEPWPAPEPRLGDPLLDPERRALLVRVLETRQTALREELREAYRERFERQGDDPGRFEADEVRRILELEARRRDLDEQLARVREGADEPLRELRFASYLALDHARALRDEGRPEEARALARRLLADLEESGLWERYFWRIELEAQVETLVGGSFMDEDEPQRAEEELSRAVERLEEYERLLAERGIPLAGVRAARSNALVSLAVNANVKQADARKAREYFERAWALRKDDFMKVLLACYEARDGDAEAARRLLAEIEPSPASWYNLACTHALLGERDRALEYLKLDLESDRHTPATLARQKRWARKDPDLAALHADERFRALVGADGEDGAEAPAAPARDAGEDGR